MSIRWRYSFSPSYEDFGRVQDHARQSASSGSQAFMVEFGQTGGLPLRCKDMDLPQKAVRTQNAAPFIRHDSVQGQPRGVSAPFPRSVPVGFHRSNRRSSNCLSEGKALF